MNLFSVLKKLIKFKLLNLFLAEICRNDCQFVGYQIGLKGTCKHGLISTGAGHQADGTSSRIVKLGTSSRIVPYKVVKYE